MNQPGVTEARLLPGDDIELTVALPGSHIGDRIQITSLVTQPQSVDQAPTAGPTADGIDVLLQGVDGGHLVVIARHRPSTPPFVPELGLVAVVQVTYADTSMLISPDRPDDPSPSWILPSTRDHALG